MFVLDRDKLAAAQTAFSTAFEGALARYTGNEEFGVVAQELRGSDPATELFFSTRLGSGMKLDTGDYSVDSLRIQSIKIAASRYYDAFQMSRDDLEYDKLNLYRPHIEQLASSYARHRAQLSINKLESGWTESGYDGVTFFNSAHPIASGGTQSNVVNTSGAGLTTDTLAEALVRLSRMKDESGNIIGLRGTALLVPPELEHKARQILTAEQISGTDNVMRGRLRLVVSPFLTDPNRAYVIDTSTAFRPIIFYEFGQPTLEPDTSRSVLHRVVLWVLSAQYSTTFGFYHFVVGIN